MSSPPPFKGPGMPVRAVFWLTSTPCYCFRLVALPVCSHHTYAFALLLSPSSATLFFAKHAPTESQGCLPGCAVLASRLCHVGSSTTAARGGSLRKALQEEGQWGEPRVHVTLRSFTPASIALQAPHLHNTKPCFETDVCSCKHSS